MVFREFKYHRLKFGLLQYQVAAAARTNPARLSQIENRRVNPSGRERVGLARVLDLSKTEVFEECVGFTTAETLGR